MTACLDAWAILAWLDGEEPAASRVSDLIESRPVVSWINLVEVYDRLERDHGRDAADETLGLLRASLAPDLPGTARMIEAARLKARASIPLGDCFAAATAAAHDLVLLTGDPELLDLADPPCRVKDLRPLERERRRAVAARDAEILARTGADPDLAGLAEHTAGPPQGRLVAYPNSELSISHSTGARSSV